MTEEQKESMPSYGNPVEHRNYFRVQRLSFHTNPANPLLMHKPLSALAVQTSF